MNDRLIDMLTAIATKNPTRRHVVSIGESWNVMSCPPCGSDVKTQLIDATDIRGSISKFVNLHAPKVI